MPKLLIYFYAYSSVFSPFFNYNQPLNPRQHFLHMFPKNNIFKISPFTNILLLCVLKH